MEGWIKLHRKILESPIFSDADLLKLWIFCLSKASHKGSSIIIDKKVIELAPGEFVTGRFSLYDEYNRGVAPRKKIKETTLWNWLKRLENCGNIDIKTTNKYSVVTVIKWCDYQEVLTTERQQIDNRLTTERQQIDTNKNVKNVKNDKNVENKDIKTSRHKQVYDPNSIPYRSANYLFKKIVEINPTVKTPNFQKWSDDMRLLIENDKREPKHVAEVIDWIFNDSFWRTNILSPAKLRKQFDTIDTKMKGVITSGKHGGHPQTVAGADRESPYAFLDRNTKQYAMPDPNVDPDAI